jgi:hypothetical protein
MAIKTVTVTIVVVAGIVGFAAFSASAELEARRKAQALLAQEQADKYDLDLARLNNEAGKTKKALDSANAEVEKLRSMLEAEKAAAKELTSVTISLKKSLDAIDKAVRNTPDYLPPLPGQR